eukprot:scaffold3704_cov91-Skeletonema_dohrnii-CCMP3373.AAC.1
MMEAEAPTERTEDAGAAVASVAVDSAGLGAVNGVGVVSGGGASLEEAPSLMEEDSLPTLPAITVNGGNGGAALLPEEQPGQPAPPSPIRRINIDQIDANDCPMDAQIFLLSQTLDLTKKRGVMSSDVSFLRPPNLQHHRLPPPHITGWDEFTWRDVILALYVWNRIMTLDQRKHEMNKSSHLRTNDGPRYRELQRNIQKLHDSRPSAVTDIADPNADNSNDDAVLPRRSSRNGEPRAQQHASDPARQERARQAANAGEPRRRTAIAVAVPPAPVEIVGLGSADAARQGIVQQRQASRNAWKKRKQGDNCTSLGMQGDAQATSTVNSLHRTAALTMETLYYPDLREGQPMHGVIAVSYNELDTYNPDGGRSSSTGRRAEKPSLTITAESREAAIDILKQVAKALSEMKNKEESSDGVYELEQVFLKCNFKDCSSGAPLNETVRRRHDMFRADNLSRPARNRDSMDLVQQNMPADVLAGADMSPGVRDRRMVDARDE